MISKYLADKKARKLKKKGYGIQIVDPRTRHILDCHIQDIEEHIVMTDGVGRERSLKLTAIDPDTQTVYIMHKLCISDAAPDWDHLQCFTSIGTKL